MERDYKQNLSYKQNVAKMRKKNVPIHDGRANVLPPIRDSPIQGATIESDTNARFSKRNQAQSVQNSTREIKEAQT